MADIPDDDLAGTRAALAPTLAATAAVLPWLKKQREPRFPDEINRRWIRATQTLAATWSDRHEGDWAAFRQAVIALYAVAIDSRDVDCLALGEALASAADRLDDGSASTHLVAALCATTECLDEASGLEHDAFPQRARHFTQRLLAATEQPTGNERSPLIDRLFAAETRERLLLMREALDALPPDPVLIKDEARLIGEQAELIELYGIMELARRIVTGIDGASDLEESSSRRAISETLLCLEQAIAAL